MVDELADGRPGCVLVEGPAGIGKSRLLVEAMRLATAAEVRVLSARGSQLERSFGFGAVRQLFEPCTSDPAARDTLLAGAASVARPVFEEVAGDEAVNHGSFAVLHGLYWLTVNLANTGPVVICVDDIQWCDSASLRYLAYLVKRLEGLHVLVVLAMRTGEQHPDDALLADLAARHVGHRAPARTAVPGSGRNPRPGTARRRGRHVRRGLPPDDLGQPTAAAAAAARPGG